MGDDATPEEVEQLIRDNPNDFNEMQKSIMRQDAQRRAHVSGSSGGSLPEGGSGRLDGGRWYG